MSEIFGSVILLALLGYGVYREIRFHRWCAGEMASCQQTQEPRIRPKVAYPGPKKDLCEMSLRLGCSQVGCSLRQETRGTPLDPPRRALPRGETT